MPCILGLDVGTKRIGVARAALDPDGRARLAAPLLTIQREGVRRDAERLLALAGREQATVFVVGLPYDLEGQEGRSARLARQVGEAIAGAGLTVHYQDERFSTVEASNRLRQRGLDSREQRLVIDQAAAAVILQDWLERAPRGDAV